MDIYPDSKVHGAYMGPTWGQQDPGGRHVGPMNLAIRVEKGFLYLTNQANIRVITFYIRVQNDELASIVQIHCLKVNEKY